ncbi:MAG TPA: FAD-binding oxidoreductase [Bacillaceae bacterium]
MKKFVVIGGGILGASAAYHLAKSGAEVTIIDRQDPGQATDAAAGIICPWLTQRRNKAWYALAKKGAAYYEPLIRQLKEDGETETGYRKSGAISLHTDTGKLEQMKERAVTRRGDAPEIGDIKKLGKEETKAVFPPLSAEYGSLYISGAARVNGRALRDALLNAAKKHGAEWVSGSAVLMHEGNRVIGVRAEERTFSADGILVTAGAWAGELFEPLGIRLKVSGQKAQILHLQLEKTDTADWPVVMPPNNQYILAFDGGRVVIGATHEDNAGFDLRVTAGGMQEILNKALDVSPGLADGGLKEVRVGFRPFTPGFLPVIGAVPGYEGVYLANGLGASGLTVGPFLGAQLAKLVLCKELDIELGLYNVQEAMEM